MAINSRGDPREIPGTQLFVFLRVNSTKSMQNRIFDGNMTPPEKKVYDPWTPLASATPLINSTTTFSTIVTTTSAEAPTHLAMLFLSLKGEPRNGFFEY